MTRPARNGAAWSFWDDTLECLELELNINHNPISTSISSWLIATHRQVEPYSYRFSLGLAAGPEHYDTVPVVFAHGSTCFDCVYVNCTLSSPIDRTRRLSRQLSQHRLAENWSHYGFLSLRNIHAKWSGWIGSTLFLVIRIVNDSGLFQEYLLLVVSSIVCTIGMFARVIWRRHSSSIFSDMDKWATFGSSLFDTPALYFDNRPSSWTSSFVRTGSTMEFFDFYRRNNVRGTGGFCFRGFHHPVLSAPVWLLGSFWI